MTLGPGDIYDLRAYERVRERYRAYVMGLKRRRRVALGPIMTVVFENAETVRFQIQEMARVERIISDEGIAAELDVYRGLLPAPGELSATLFIELTTEADLREWLPRLVGIERTVGVRLGEGADAEIVRSEPEGAHAASLTRDAVTPAVHYLRFAFTPAAAARFADPALPVALVADHPAYRAATPLPADTRDELRADLEGRAGALWADPGGIGGGAPGTAGT